MMTVLVYTKVYQVTIREPLTEIYGNERHTNDD